MAATEYYYYGQGKVFSRPYGTVGRGGWRWWLDVSVLTVALAVEKLEHKESYTGAKGLARSFPTATGLTLNATVHQLDTTSLAELMYGTASAIASGAVVGEDLGTVAVGDIIKLDYRQVSALTIVDSTSGTPVAFGSTRYDLDARFGSLEILSLPTSPAPVFPLKASYSYAAGKQVNFFTRAQPVLEVRYEGLNLAEGNRPVIAEFYKVGTDPLQNLALINNDQNLSGAQISAGSLIDTARSASGVFGQYGRIVQM
jgi:hypothetical protein